MDMMVTWSPWQELSRLEQAMNDMLDGGKTARAADTVPTWTPPVDVFEDQARIVLVADLPGVDEKDVELSVEKNVLTLKGARKNALPTDGGHRRLERPQGNFVRAFTLPSTIDVEKINAELRGGVLTLTLQKKAEAQPRQIKISAS
jgi:HSP20 family protein